jgi:hypothetical protein
MPVKGTPVNQHHTDAPGYPADGKQREIKAGLYHPRKDERIGREAGNTQDIDGDVPEDSLAVSPLGLRSLLASSGPIGPVLRRSVYGTNWKAGFPGFKHSDRLVLKVEFFGNGMVSSHDMPS